MCKRIVTAIALVVVWFLSGNAHGEELFPFGARIDTGELPLRGGVVNCTLVITPNVDLVDITIELREADSLEYIGPNQFDCSGKAGDTCRHTFDVVDLPPS